MYVYKKCLNVFFFLLHDICYKQYMINIDCVENYQYFKLIHPFMKFDANIVFMIVWSKAYM